MLLLIVNKVTYHSTEITGMYKEIDTRSFSNRLRVTSMIADCGQHEGLLPITHKNYNFREKKYSQVMKERENLH